MSLFDHFFPEVAQIEELRRIADSTSLAAHHSKLARARMDQEKLSTGRRIQELENEVAQLTIVIEAMLEHFCDSGATSREQLAARIARIDLRDGIADGKITKEEAPAKKVAKKEPRFIFPD